MFIHVIPKTPLRHFDGVLTYQTAQPVVVGQLVAVPVRGRIVPGIVAKVKVAAGTSARILNIKRISANRVPLPFLQFIRLVSDYYIIPPSQVLERLGSFITLPYLKETLPKKDSRQLCWITPSVLGSKKRFGQNLDTVAKDKALARRTQWLKALSGHPLAIVGTQSALTLPYLNLKQLVLDLPTASPYVDSRSPGFNAAVLACLAAKAYNASLIIRSLLPESALATFLPLPQKVILKAPPLRPITLFPLKNRSIINSELIDDLKEKIKAKKKILIYYNLLTRKDESGKLYGIDQIALELEKNLSESVSVFGQSTAKDDKNPVTIGTSAVLYNDQIKFDHAYILSLESLISSNLPLSPLAAVEVITIIASRMPLTAQYQSSDHFLVKFIKSNFNSQLWNKVGFPTFTHRLVTLYNPHPSPSDNNFIAQVEALWPETTSIKMNKKTVLKCLTNRVFTLEERAFLLALPAGWKALTDTYNLSETL